MNQLLYHRNRIGGDNGHHHQLVRLKMRLDPSRKQMFRCKIHIILFIECGVSLSLCLRYLLSIYFNLFVNISIFW